VHFARSRILVAGATGVLGRALSTELATRGAALALAGRDEQRLARLADEVAQASSGRPPPQRTMDAYDLAGCAELPGWAAHHLRGLDAVVTTVGVAAFGGSGEVGDTVAEHVMTVNALCPMATLRAVFPLLAQGGAVAAVSGVLADRPQPRMADYGAAKAALSHWLTAVRAEERRRGVHVLDARLPHLDTGFADRAVTGTAPPLPTPVPANEAARAILDALRSEANVLLPGEGGGFVTAQR
jgi:short-subunit dehydrogenase